MLKKAIVPVLAFLSLISVPASAHARLQCVPYARSVSDVQIHGNAYTWWDQADGSYERGNRPRVGAVLTFKKTRAMPLGHVAVVREILDDRRVLLNHANWSGPGMIERQALAIDVSDAGDWSKVRVWYAPQHGMGLRENPTYGFIYATATDSEPVTTIASAVKESETSRQLGHNEKG
jgi:surface antigen